MADTSKISPDGGSTIYDIKDKKAVHWSEAQGYVTKNLIPFPYYNGRSFVKNGITFTVDDNGVITANGTSTSTAGFLAASATARNFYLKAGNYKATAGDNLSGKASVVIGRIKENNQWEQIANFSSSTGAVFTITEAQEKYPIQVSCEVWSNTTVSDFKFYPMICYASVADDTYAAPLISNNGLKDAYKTNRVLGAKNLLPWVAPSKASTLTVTNNGYDGITISGSKSTGWADIIHNVTFTLKAGITYVLSCKGVPNYVKGIRLKDANGQDIYNMTEGIWENRFTPNADATVTQWRTILATDSALNDINFTYYPMILIDGDFDDTYAPYAMTNKELTDKVVNLTRMVESTENLNDIMQPGLYYCDGSPTNSPQSLSWYMLIVTGRQGAIQQLVNKKELIYARSYGGNPATWSSWYKFTGTEVS